MEHYEYILKNGKNLKLSRTEADFLRSKIETKINAVGTLRLSPYSNTTAISSVWSATFRFVAFGLILILGTGSGVVFASERVSPESILYPIKITLTEPLVRSLQTTLSDKVLFEQKILARRIEERALLEQKPNISDTTKNRVAIATKESFALYNQLIEKSVSQGRLALVEQSVESVEVLLSKHTEKTATPTVAVMTVNDQNQTTQAEIEHTAITPGEKSALLTDSHLHEELLFLQKTRDAVRLAKTGTKAPTTETQKTKQDALVATLDATTTSQSTQREIGLTTKQLTQGETPSVSGVLVVYIDQTETVCADTSCTAKNSASNGLIRITDTKSNSVVTQREITTTTGRTEIILPKGKYLISYINQNKKMTQPQIAVIDGEKTAIVNFAVRPQ